MFHDFYDILGVDTEASPDEIKSAYRRRAREAHPDRHQGDAKQQNEEMSLINEAYSVLSNRQKRTEYDIVWRRYYKSRGQARRKGVDVSTFESTWSDNYELDRPVVERPKRPEPPTKVPFWQNQKVLIWVLVVLVIILVLDVYLTYFRGHTFGGGVFREIAHGYEYALGKDYRESASDRHLERSHDVPPENQDDRLWRIQRALELDPDNIEAALVITPLLYERGMFGEAIRISRHALLLIEDIDEPSPDMETLRVHFIWTLYRTYMQLGEWNDAHTFLTDLETTGFTNNESLLDFAVVKYEMNLMEGAREYAERYLEYNENIDAEILIIMTYISEGNFAQAEEIALNALEGNPDNPSLNHVLGESYFHEGRHTLAVEHLRKGIPASPDPVNTDYMIGLSYFKSGSLQNAIASLTEVVIADPGHFDGRMWLGRAYQSLGDYDSARSHFYSALEIYPNSQEARNALDGVPSA